MDGWSRAACTPDQIPLPPMQPEPGSSLLTCPARVSKEHFCFSQSLFLGQQPPHVGLVKDPLWGPVGVLAGLGCGPARRRRRRLRLLLLLGAHLCRLKGVRLTRHVGHVLAAPLFPALQAAL